MRAPLAAVALLAGLAGCASKDPGEPLGGDRLAEAPPVAQVPRPRPAALVHVTLKVLGMT